MTFYTVSFEDSDITPFTKIPRGERVFLFTPLKKERDSFLGWYKDKHYSGKWNFRYDTVSNDTNLYAKWEPLYFSVSFDDSKIKDLRSIKYGSTINKPPNPQKEHFVFDGWYMV